MKISDEDNQILYCKRAITDVLEDPALTFFLGASPQTPILEVDFLWQR